MINDDTQEIGCGPLGFDVKMARKLGWDQTQINNTWVKVKRISVTESEFAKLCHPKQWFTAPGGTDIFIGDLSEKDKSSLIDSYKKKKE